MANILCIYEDGRAKVYTSEELKAMHEQEKKAICYMCVKEAPKADAISLVKECHEEYGYSNEDLAKNLHIVNKFFK